MVCILLNLLEGPLDHSQPHLGLFKVWILQAKDLEPEGLKGVSMSYDGDI